MKYYCFYKNNSRVGIRQWEITINGQKSLQLIFVNKFGSQPLMPDFIPFFMDYDLGDDLFFVSEKVKIVLEKFLLPYTTFTPLPIYWEDKIRKRYKINEPTIYYKVSMDIKACQQLWDFDKSRFIFLGNDKAWSYSIDSIKDVRSFTIKNYQEYYKTWLDENLRSQDKYLTPKTKIFKGKYDAMYILGELVFNEFVCEALKNAGIESIVNHTYFNPYLTFDNVSLPEVETDEHRSTCQHIVQNLKLEKSIVQPNETDEIIKRETEKRDRLLLEKNLVKEYYKKHKPLKDSAIVLKEIELVILFPDDFPDIMSNPEKFELPEGFFMLKLNEIASLGIDKDYWQEFIPSAVKAVGFASNGCGDYIGYILEEDSDIQLDSQWILFNHETGTIDILD